MNFWIAGLVFIAFLVMGVLILAGCHHHRVQRGVPNNSIIGDLYRTASHVGPVLLLLLAIVVSSFSVLFLSLQEVANNGPFSVELKRSLPGYGPNNIKFSTQCQPDFNITGNAPLDLAFTKRVLWAHCMDDNKAMNLSSLDLGPCYADNGGVLVEQVGGFFNRSCLDCNRDLQTTSPTFYCHCDTPDLKNASETHKFLYTSINLDETLQVHNGILACIGGSGGRGGQAPMNIGP